jgi:tetratricopeptide (TPR) repeat protein
MITRFKFSLTTILFIVIIQLSLNAQNHSNIDLANQYYEQGEIDKAIEIYEQLARNPKNIPLIHQNYFSILINNGRYEEAEDYIKKLIKRNPENLFYQVDRGLIFISQNEKEKEKDYFNTFIEKHSDDNYQVSALAQYMARKRLYEYALQMYLESRKNSGSPDAYALQLANIYRVLNQKDKMIMEYLLYVQEHPSSLPSIKNILQNYLENEEDLESFEALLIDKLQKDPNQPLYQDLLIWVNVQQHDFYGAFIQARAYDKKNNLAGSGMIELGQIALENNDYNNAIRIYNYVIDNYEGTSNYQIARRLVIMAREEKVKNTYPVDTEDIKTLINDYDQLINEVGLNQFTVEALRNKALLHAFYLNEHQKAISILGQIIKYPRMRKDIIDRSKLDLGDIYLLIGQPWESTLLYSQVEKSNKASVIGYEAKLRNAKLSYYKGDFALAQDHLDILKEATTREISNDAMKLSMLIKDNTALDTTDVPMQLYASIDLLLFQNKYDQALQKLDSFQNRYRNHSLVDEVLWQKSQIYLQLGKFEEAASNLQQLDEGYSYDIFGDDAYFTLGKIYQDNMDEPDKAMQIFREFLEKYPGSVYTSEARKRFRQLRGDFNN